MSIKEQDSYIQGLEDGIEIVKAIYSLDRFDRQKYFHETKVSNILNRFDFAQIREIVNGIKHEDIREIKKYYIIRGIHINLNNNEKSVVAESIKLAFAPDEEMINTFLAVHTDVDFAVCEEIYVRG